MHNQPDSTPRRISAAACVCLAVAACAGTILAAIIYIEVTTPLRAYPGVPAALAAIAAVAGIGYIVRSAEDRVTCCIDRLEATIVAHREQGNAAAAAERINLRLLQGQG